MTDENPPEPRYKWNPIVATATKVGQVKGKDVLKIDVPIQEDSNIIIEAAKKKAAMEEERKQEEVKRRKEEERKKQEEKELKEKAKKEKEEQEKREREQKGQEYTNKIPFGNVPSGTGTAVDYFGKNLGKESVIKDKKKGDKKMEDIDIDEKVDARVSKKLQEMDIQKTIKDIGLSSVQTEKKVLKIEGQLDTLEGLIKDLVEEQKGIKTGLQGEIGETKSNIDKYGEKIEHVHKKVEDIEKKIPDKVLCSGDKGCNAEVEVGSSFCHNCGREIEEWPDMPDWVPYPQRNK